MLKLIGINKINYVSRFVLSVGLSLIFLMFLGLALNGTKIFGINAPLSFSYLFFALHLTVFMLEFLVLMNGNNDVVLPFKSNGFFFISLLLLLPVISGVGIFCSIIYNDNFLLLLSIICVSLLFCYILFSDNFLLNKTIPVVLFIFSLSLLLPTLLFSEYIFPMASDVPVEYFIFRRTAENMNWAVNNPFHEILYGRLNSMLSITILPTIFLNMLYVSPEFIIKTLYPFILCLIPIALFELWRNYINKKMAFVAAFLFISQSSYYTEMLGVNRQIIAELFFCLLLLVICNKNIPQIKRYILFLLFSFGLIISHYGLSEIFFIFLLFSVTWFIVVRRKSNGLNITYLITFFAIMFLWYIYTSNGSVFQSFVSYAEYVLQQLGDFLVLESRDPAVLRAIGLESTSPLNWVSRIFSYITQLFIVIGFLSILLKSAKFKLDIKYTSFAIVAMIMLILLILIPGLANTMNMLRFYHVLLFILAPFFSIGINFAVSFTFKRRYFFYSLLVVIILVPFFLFQTGFIYEITKSDSWSIPLSSYRMTDIRLYGHFGFIDMHNVFASQWLSRENGNKTLQIYSDRPSRFNVLTSYGMIYRWRVIEITNATILSPYSLIFLNKLNVNHNIFISGGNDWSLNELVISFEEFNIVYSNGENMIFKVQF